MIRIGFSGTREGMSAKQLSVFSTLLHTKFDDDKTSEFHHGDCVGADTEAHRLAEKIGYCIIIHPPLDRKMQAYNTARYHRHPMPYKARNRAIVLACDLLIACPKDDSEKGGTWNTINWARMYSRSHIIIHSRGEATFFNNPQNLDS